VRYPNGHATGRSRPVLRADELTLEHGEAVAVVGPSGAGKTTLLRVMAAALRPTEGVVSVDGRSIAEMAGRDLRSLRASIGLVHQDLRLVPNLRVAQNVMLGNLGRLSLGASLRTFLAPPRADVLRAHALLERVGIAEKLYERTDRLSGGQQQRVAVARALFQSPRALLADEPVASVDPARARAMIELLTEVSRQQRITLCVSLHDLELARTLFPRLVGLRDGRILFDRPTADVGPEELADLYRLEPGTRPVPSNGHQPDRHP
jgi:phosphonate transport system ATP-binding protein